MSRRRSSGILRAAARDCSGQGILAWAASMRLRRFRIATLIWASRVTVALTQIGAFASLDEGVPACRARAVQLGWGLRSPTHAVAVLRSSRCGLDFLGSAMILPIRAYDVRLYVAGGTLWWAYWVGSPPSPLIPTRSVSLRLSHNHLRACLAKGYICALTKCFPPAPPLTAQRAERAGSLRIANETLYEPRIRRDSSSTSSRAPRQPAPHSDPQ